MCTILVGKCHQEFVRIFAVCDFAFNCQRQAHSFVLAWKYARVDRSKHAKNVQLPGYGINGRVVRGNHHWNAHNYITFARNNSAMSIPHVKTGGGAHTPAHHRYTAMLYKQLATSLSKRTKASRTVAVS